MFTPPGEPFDHMTRPQVLRGRPVIWHASGVAVPMTRSARLSALVRALAPTLAAADGELARSRDALAERERGPGARSGPAKEGYNVPNPCDKVGHLFDSSLGINAPALLTDDRNELLHAVSPGPDGLSDDDVRGFCARGFLVIKPSGLSAAHHAANLTEFNRMQDDEGKNRGFGSNKGSFGMHMPGLEQVYADAAVVSARRSLLGPGNVMHQHNATHLTSGGGTANQVWHKDPYGPEAAVRHKHAFRICMALYYPQTTTLELGRLPFPPISHRIPFGTVRAFAYGCAAVLINPIPLPAGPTGIVPSRYSHTVLSSTHCMATQEVDQPLTVEAGSVVMIHGDT